MIVFLRMMLPVVALAATWTPAMARPLTTTRLVTCGTGNCLLVRGRRLSPHAAIRINGRPVEATGGTRWRIRLPVATVRAWSAPSAHMLHVAVTEPGGTMERSSTVRLPVGMLARSTELALLVVRAR